MFSQRNSSAEEFKEIFRNQIALLPSNLRYTTFTKLNKRFSRKEFRKTTVTLAASICARETGIVRIFVGKVALKLTKFFQKCFAICVATLRRK